MSSSDAESQSAAGAESQLTAFIEKFDAADQKLIRSVRTALRKRLPAAYELAYDNYNFFVIGYSATDRPSEAVLSIAAGSSGVGLCFIHGAKLPDPKKLLQGSGKQTRFIRLESASVLDRPDVQELIGRAIAQSAQPFADGAHGKLVIRSVSAKQRPRKKARKKS